MLKFRVVLHVFRKIKCVNPENGPILAQLKRMGFDAESFSKGTCMIIDLSAEDESCAKLSVGRMCVDGGSFFLVNPVMEDYEIVSVTRR